MYRFSPHRENVKIFMDQLWRHVMGRETDCNSNPKSICRISSCSWIWIIDYGLPLLQIFSFNTWNSFTLSKSSWTLIIWYTKERFCALSVVISYDSREERLNPQKHWVSICYLLYSYQAVLSGWICFHSNFRLQHAHFYHKRKPRRSDNLLKFRFDTNWPNI